MKTLATSLLIFCASCATISVSTKVPFAGPEVKATVNQPFGSGQPVLDLTAQCPAGIASETTGKTFGDVMFGTVTLGIYQPTTILYRCVEK